MLGIDILSVIYYHVAMSNKKDKKVVPLKRQLSDAELFTITGDLILGLVNVLSKPNLIPVMRPQGSIILSESAPAYTQLDKLTATQAVTAVRHWLANGKVPRQCAPVEPDERVILEIAKYNCSV